MTRPLSIDEFSELVMHLYDGPFETVPWSRFMQHIRATLDIDMAFLILRSPRPGDAGLMLSAGWPNAAATDPDTANVYASQQYALDPFINLPPERVVTLDEYIGADTLRNSEFYTACLQPAGIFHVAGIDVTLPEFSRASFRLTRRADQPGFSGAEKQLLQTLVPHLKRALAIHARFSRIETERSLYDRAMTQLSLGTIILDENRQVIRLNRVAEKMLAQKDGFRVAEGLIHLDRSADNIRLRNLLNSVIVAQRGNQTQVAQAIAIPRSHGRAPLTMVIRPVMQAEWSDRQHAPAVALFISDPELPLHASIDTLAQLFGLTPAESRLALQLINGVSLEEASTALGISRNTARAHLRSIFTKTGVTQQTMLVSLILKSVAAMTASES